MVNWISKLLVSSPFEPLQEHQQKVQQCAEMTVGLIDACLEGDYQQVKAVAKQVSMMEHEADILKNQVRDRLPHSLFMPVSRGDLLAVLAAQDSIADCAEDLGVLLTMRHMEPLPDELATLLRELAQSSLEVVRTSTQVVEQLNVLANSSFSGPEAQRVMGLIDELDRKEHLADKIQDRLAKRFFAHEDSFKPAAIVLWMKIFNKVGDLSNYAEKMTHQIRLFMAR
jgi:hypothetical protein